MELKTQMSPKCPSNVPQMSPELKALYTLAPPSFIRCFSQIWHSALKGGVVVCPPFFSPSHPKTPKNKKQKAPQKALFHKLIPLSFSLLFSLRSNRSNSPLGDFSLTLSTNSLKRLLNVFKSLVRSFKNDLALLYIEPISFVKSFTRDFNVLFSSSNSL